MKQKALDILAHTITTPICIGMIAFVLLIRLLYMPFQLISWAFDRMEKL